MHDGSLRDIALVQGDDAYTTLMRQLATGPMERVPDHLGSNWEKLQYLKARAQRLANKLAGRPATPETAIIASLVSKLVAATKAALGDEQAVVAAVISSSDRIHLTDEELGDVFDYLKLRHLMSGPNTLYQLYATSAAYAGYAKGLCQTYTDAYDCETEEAFLPYQRLLHLDLSAASLSGTIKSLQTVKDGSSDASFVDPDLGFGQHSGSLTTTAAEGESAYWTAVSYRIRTLVKSLNRLYMPHVSELILTGPSAADKRFQDAVRTALQDLIATDGVLAGLDAHGQSSNGPAEWQSFLTFATARGAAEIAKRRQEGPVSCAQSNDCKQRRERVHHDGQRQSEFVQQQVDLA